MSHLTLLATFHDVTLTLSTYNLVFRVHREKAIIVNKIMTAPFYSIIFHTTQDISKRDQLSEQYYFVIVKDQDGTPKALVNLRLVCSLMNEILMSKKNNIDFLSFDSSFLNITFTRFSSKQFKSLKYSFGLVKSLIQFEYLWLSFA